MLKDKFNYTEIVKALFSPKIINLLTDIAFQFGVKKTQTFSLPKQWAQNIKLLSTKTSSELEGIYRTDARWKTLVLKDCKPRTKNEVQISGYAKAWDIVTNSTNKITPAYIKHLHALLMQTEDSSFKVSNNRIIERWLNGTIRICFQPVPALLTATYMNTICDSLNDYLNSESPSLLVIPCFVLDFLCIHPFDDGNGRVSRLLTIALLSAMNININQEMSLEAIIQKTSKDYYDTLQMSSQGWHDWTNDYTPFVEYFLNVLLSALKTFNTQIQTMKQQTDPKKIVLRIISDHITGISKSDLQMLTFFSVPKVERILAELKQAKLIIQKGRGKTTKYLLNLFDLKVDPFVFLNDNNK